MPKPKLHRSPHPRSRKKRLRETKNKHTRQKNSKVTVEVALQSRRIIQARGKTNRMPTSDEQRYIQQWAEANGLTLQ